MNECNTRLNQAPERQQDPADDICTKISVSAKSTYLPEQSLPQEQTYAFSYTITITNNSEQAVRLLTRSWLITDANGETSTVEGEGVVGQTPDILPGASFSYTSGSVFETPLGTMQGYYQLQNPQGESLRAEIPVFRLAVPNILN
ncbi:Co2+/Mg2+ efflux protein ApaG [Thalassomonas actiniarum]|uniref:Protein ApaG n=1 Tax=Thalassomonas actiniarum TaxID=485447 RepID=A0AAF0C614_9GAMM|nr:Co2+/Mg2+ efflux protein ApaG [Thalassomonas actiniarum]WDE01726.1 Co2+/Mg2+ efflux protein ApaG [Thalassomonas actiniarum]